MPTSAPTSFRVRAYNVGFGDCFLLSFTYPKRQRHILIDFGSSGRDDDRTENGLVSIARDIEKACDGKLDAVVATHRHVDHINGFATNSKGTGPGDIIRALKPRVVVQPWTEDPKAAVDATKPTASLSAKHAFVRSLWDMHSVAEHAMSEISHLSRSRSRIGKRLAAEIAFIGEDNLKNLSAVKNLMSMPGAKKKYVFAGSSSGLESLLPGVTVSVLGPPTLEQCADIANERARNASEYWHIQARSLAKPAAALARRRLRGASTVKPVDCPPYARWFVDRIDHSRAQELLELVRTLDSAMNNTSVILLFEIGPHKLLFPGDAQWENWQFSLADPAIQAKLHGVTFYKVGHHGSLNGTPKSLWNLFANRSKSPTKPNRLTTVVSTMGQKYGSFERNTEVPRRTLIEALKEESDFHTTQDIRGAKLCDDLVFDV